MNSLCARQNDSWRQNREHGNRISNVDVSFGLLAPLSKFSESLMSPASTTNPRYALSLVTARNSTTSKQITMWAGIQVRVCHTKLSHCTPTKASVLPKLLQLPPQVFLCQIDISMGRNPFLAMRQLCLTHLRQVFLASSSILSDKCHLQYLLQLKSHFTCC